MSVTVSRVSVVRLVLRLQQSVSVSIATAVLQLGWEKGRVQKKYLGTI